MLAACWLLCAPVGCATVKSWWPWKKDAPPSTTLTLPPPGPAASSTGAAQVPAQVTRTTTTTTLPLPAGTTVTADASGPSRPSNALAYTLPTPSAVTVATVKETATGPQDYAPPAPPTPGQVAEGAGVANFYKLAIGAGVGALAAAYLQFYRAAAILGAVALGVPLLIHFFNRSGPLISHGAAVAIGLALGLGVAYEIMSAKGLIRPAAPAPVPPVTPA